MGTMRIIFWIEPAALRSRVAHAQITILTTKWRQLATSKKRDFHHA